MLPRIFRNLHRRRFLNYLSSFIERTEFLGLWLNVLEHCGTVGAAFVEEIAQVPSMNILTNELHDKFGRDGEFKEIYHFARIYRVSNVICPYMAAL